MLSFLPHNRAPSTPMMAHLKKSLISKNLFWIRLFAIFQKTESCWSFQANELNVIKNGRKVAKPYYLKNDDESFIRFTYSGSQIILESINSKYEKNYWLVENDMLVPYTINDEDGKNLYLFQAGENYLIYGKKDHIIIQNKKGEKALEYTITEKWNSTIDFKEVLIDRQNIVWATSKNGVYKIIPKKNLFKTFQSGNSIRGIYSEDQTLFVGGYEQNLMIDLKSNVILTFPEDEDAFSSFQRDKRGNLWIGTTFNGVFLYHPKTNDWKRYKAASRGHLYLTYHNPITERIWIGSGNGLFYIDSGSDQVEQYPLPVDDTDTEIRQFYQNEKGIWIITSNGLFLMNAETEKIIQHLTVKNGFPEDNLNYLYEDSSGIFWLATKLGGLIRWDVSANSFQQFTQKEGLSNNTVYAVYEDDYNTLWLPSNYGLMRFDKISHSVQVFLPENGIAHEEFNTFAHHKASDGTLYFGGINGITAFHPKNIDLNKSQNYPIYLTGLQVLDQQSNNFIDKTTELNTSKSVYLKHNDRMLEIEVTLLDFQYKANHQFAYKIEGVHNDWLYTNKNKITLIGLPYGNHLIKIKGKGSSGNWNNQILEIPIYVDAPFYLKWPFILSALAMIIALVGMGIRWRVHALKSERTRLEKEVENRTREIESDKQIIASQAEELKQLDIAKTHFFSNITHEFRTPLTLIIGPLEQLITSPPPPTIFKRRLQGVLKNARHILALINQLLDISKIESGQMKVELVKGDIVDYTRELINRFQSMCKNKGQRLYFLADKKSWSINFDSNKWDKIIYNLLSNAIKFTPEGKEIQVSLMETCNKDESNLKLSRPGFRYWHT